MGSLAAITREFADATRDFAQFKAEVEAPNAIDELMREIYAYLACVDIVRGD